MIDLETAKKVIKSFPKGISKLGINVEQIDSFPVLGTGTHGVAFEVGDGRVLKITDDKKEAAVANLLINKNLPNIVNFYDVWSFGKTGVFGILQEKLLPLSSDEAKKFNDALIATGLPVWIKHSKGEWDVALKLTNEYIKKSIKKQLGSLDSEEAEELEATKKRQLYNLIWKYGIEDMFKTLTGLGIGFHDYHAGNIMRREDGTLVLIDLGISELKGSSGPFRMIKEAYNKMLSDIYVSKSAVRLNARQLNILIAEIKNS